MSGFTRHTLCIRQKTLQTLTGTSPHQLDLFLADHVLGLGSGRHVQSNEVRLFQQSVKI
jgi:hypothetical protein